MDKPNKKLKTPSNTKLISHYVKNIEFNSTSKKPVSHYVKNDEPINHCSRPISHYIRTGQLKNSSCALISNYLSSSELKNRSENTEPEPTCLEMRRVRSRRNYISQIISQDAHLEQPGCNIGQLISENCKENDSNHHQMVHVNESAKEPSRKIHRSKSVLISDYIKNSQSSVDSSIYLGKSQLISKLIGLDANICSTTAGDDKKIEQAEIVRHNEAELNQNLVNFSKKKPRGNFISYYLQSKGSDDSPMRQKTEPDLIHASSGFVKLRRSKLISQYISNENIDWTSSAQLVEKMQEPSKPKSKQASRSRYISSFIKQYEEDSLLADSSPHTLNKIIRRNLALSSTRNGRRVFKRNKIQKDKFIKKYIKLDNIVNRLRKTKKLD